MFTPQALIEHIQTLDRGEPRLAAYKNAIQEADQASAHEWRFYFRYEYLKESIFHDDNYKAIIIFPELLQVFDEHPELADENSDDMMLAFKWTLENLFDFYQVSEEEIEKYFTEFKLRCQKYGYSLRVWHMKRAKYLLSKNIDEAVEEMKCYRTIRRDGISDCAACEASFDMQIMLEKGDEEEAMRLAEPILSGKRRCGEIPHYTYGHLAEYYFYKGNISDALYYAALCERYIGNRPEFLDLSGILIDLYCFLNINHAWKLLKSTVGSFIASRNPHDRMIYARGAAKVFRTVEELNRESDPDYDGITPSPLFRALPVPATEKGVKMQDLADYFYNLAKEQSERLDKRSGSEYYMQKLLRTAPDKEQLEAVWEAAREEGKPLHGITGRNMCAFAVTLPEGISLTLEEIAARFQAAPPDGCDIISAGADDEDFHTTLRYEGRIYEYSLVKAEPDSPLAARACCGLDEERFLRMRDPSEKYLLRTELGDSPFFDYHLAMQLLYRLFPEMLGVVDLVNQHGYPSEWVHFAAAYENAVSPHDIFGLYIYGNDEGSEINITTIGLTTLGLRELEINGADAGNFGMYADMLDEIAAQVAERNLLPDEGGRIAYCRRQDGEQNISLNFTWGSTEKYVPEGSLAAEFDRPAAAGVVLVQQEEGEPVPVTELGIDGEELEWPTTNPAFYRRRELARESFGLFRQTVQKPFERAAVRLEFEIDEEIADELGYSLELLWADVVSADADGITVRLGEEEPDSLPDLHIGDELTLTEAGKVCAWFVQPAGWEETIGQGSAFLLMKEE